MQITVHLSATLELMTLNVISSHHGLPPFLPPPRYLYFQRISIMFKLVLWATLVFFSYGSQLQIGAEEAAARGGSARCVMSADGLR